MKISKKEIIFLVLFIIVVSVIAISIKNIIRDSQKQKEIDTILNVEFNNPQEGEGNVNVTPPGEGIIQEPSTPKEEPTISGNAVAIIDIPSVGVKGVVKPGTDNETLKNYIGKFDGSVNPGEVGNFSVAAHNNIYTELFRNLNKVKKGAEVKVITREKTYVYKVTSIQTVSPTAIEVIYNGDKKEITLITCNSNASARIVVKGELVE